MKFDQLCEELETAITTSYEEGVSLDEAEKLMFKCLAIRLLLSAELSKVDLDTRMKKSGVKAVKAAIYLEAATKDPKKPSDVMLGAIVDSNELVRGEQDRLDAAEVKKAELERLDNIFENAHVSFRKIGTGKFE